MKKVTFLVMALMCTLPMIAHAADGFVFKNDLRLRYEYKDVDGKMNRGRARFRLRIAAMTQLDENWSVGFRLASGSDEDPTSTNQSMDDAFTEKNIWIDRAYATYRSGNFIFSAGKIANPFETTGVVWDGDINLEGAAERWTLGKRGYVTLGQMVLAENKSASDAYMLAAQVGYRFERVSLNLAYYSFSNYIENAPAARGNLFENGTKYTLMDLLIQVHLTDAFSFWGQMVTNTDAKTTLTTGDKEDTAMAIGFAYHYQDWQFKLMYADIEPNAVVGAFSDSDFGYANRKGFKASVSKKLRKHVTAAAAYFNTESSVDGSGSTNMVQMDLKFKF